MTAYQVQTLNKSFQAKPYVEKNERHQLARSLNVSEKRIIKWYERQRYLMKQKGLPLVSGEDIHCPKYFIS